MNTLYLEEIDSTNKWAKENIDILDDMTLVYTYNQTAGRGRLNRSWNYMGSDNIYASIVLKPSATMRDVYSNLTQLLCLVLAQTFEKYGVEPRIKWPNDIRINGKKISGILAESVISSNHELKGIVLGFGVNLNFSKDIIDSINQPATALNLEIGKNVDKALFLEKLLDKFCLLYNDFIRDGFLLIREDYKERAEFLNKEVAVKVFDKTYEGVATDVTENGALKIVDKNNNEQILLIGDIL